MRDRFGPKAAWRELKRQLPGWIEKGPQIPGLVHGALSRLNHMDEQQQALQHELAALREDMQQQRQQRRHQVLGTTTFISGGFLWWQAMYFGVPDLLGLSVAAAGMIWLVIKA